MPRKPIEQWTQAELIEHIRDLRKENGDRRTALSKYEEVFSRLPADMQTAMLQMVGVMADDRKAGAELFRDVAEGILGTRKEDAVTDIPPNEGQQGADGGAPASGGDPTMAKILELVEKQNERIEAMEKAAEAQNRQAVENEYHQAVARLNELGYDSQKDPVKWDNMVKLIENDLSGGDIDRAHQLYAVLYPEAEGGEGEGGEGGEGQTSDNGDGKQTEGGEGEGKPDGKFPATAGKGTSGGPSVDTGKEEEELDLSLEAVNARAMEYLTSMADAPVSNP